MTDSIMSAAELIRARETLGYSANTLAADLGLPPAVVAAWEDGRDRVPRHIARDLRWRAAVTARHQAIDASGLPQCEWVTTFEARPQPQRAKALTAHLGELLKHSEGCPACLARAAFADEHCPPLPPQPMPLWVVAVGKIGTFQDRLPTWARPAVTGGLAFGAYSVFRTVLFLPQIIAQPKYGLIALEGTSLSISIGAALGLLYGTGKYPWGRRAWRRVA